MGVCGPDPRRAQLDASTSTPAAATRCSASSGCRRRTSPASRATTEGITVPAIVDVPTGQVVTNDFAADHPRPVDGVARPTTGPAPPTSTRSTCASEIDEVIDRGLPRRQQRRLPVRVRRLAGGLRRGLRRGCSTALDWLSDRLAGRRYLVGDTITEADVRLFTTLARFDAVYHGHFKCNRQKLTEMPVLWAYARDLFQTPGFGDTVDFVAHQAALLRGPPRHQPDRHRARRSRPVRLARAARPRGARRAAVRRRHAARPRRPAPSACRPATTPSAAERGTAATGGSPLRLALASGELCRSKRLIILLIHDVFGRQSSGSRARSEPRQAASQSTLLRIYP